MREGGKEGRRDKENEGVGKEKEIKKGGGSKEEREEK